MPYSATHFCYKTSLLSFVSYSRCCELVAAQISSSCRPVFSCLFNAVLLPAPHPRGKTLFYLWSPSADTICTVSLLMPCKMTAPSPLFHCQITSTGEAHKAENTKSNSVNTLSGDSLRLSSFEICRCRNTKGLSYSSGSASLLEKLVYWASIEVNKEAAKESISWNKMQEGCLSVDGNIRGDASEWFFFLLLLLKQFLSSICICGWVVPMGE